MECKDRTVAFDDIALEGVRGVLIDLDDTIYRYDPCHASALDAAFSRDNLGLSKDDYFNTYRACRTAVTKRLAGQGACRSRLFAFQMMCEDLNCRKPFEQAFTLDQVYWDTFLSVMTPHASALGFLARCKELQLPVCIVTDMTAHVQIRKIDRLGIGKFIDQLVTSEEVGAEKPDARMFSLALQKLGIDARDAIMLGDSFKKDVRGALSLGIRGYRVDLNEMAAA
ncbi:HAD family hydrolase [Martelella sp. HB161492]|uniref:HAD family hydrolase n=1 Tax=Martelella sp. HB161492 TaxID=2720726 RepID=UPI00159263D7|nr:HAD family hydrolase [Martelella sp. HB161492]